MVPGAPRRWASCRVKPASRDTGDGGWGTLKFFYNNSGACLCVSPIVCGTESPGRTGGDRARIAG